MPGACRDDIAVDHHFAIHILGSALSRIQGALGNGGDLSPLNAVGGRQDLDAMTDAGDGFDDCTATLLRK